MSGGVTDVDQMYDYRFRTSLVSQADNIDISKRYTYN